MCVCAHVLLYLRCVKRVVCWDGGVLQILGLDEGHQRFVVRTVVLVGDGSGVVHGRPGLLPESGSRKA